MITHITVEDAAKLISRLTNANEMQALTYIREAADRGEIQTADALEKLQADLARVTAERDAAIADMEALMWFSGEGCRICAHAVEVHKEPYVRLDCNQEKGTDCSPVWRGIKED